MIGSNQAGNVIIIDRAGVSDANLPEALRSRGFRTEVVTTISEALKRTFSVTKPVLFLDLGMSPTLSIQATQELLATSEILKFPLVLLGTGIDQFEIELKQKLPLFIPIKPPAKYQVIVSSIEYAHEKHTARERIAPPIVTNDSKSFIPKGVSIPDAVFGELNRLKISGVKLFGENLPKINDQGLDGKAIRPASSKIYQFVNKELQSAKPNYIRRFYRVNFTVQQLATALSLDAEKALELSTLYAKAFIAGPEELLTKDYSGSRRSAFRKDLCSRIKDSAMEVGFGSENQEHSRLISHMAKVIGDEQVLTDDPEGMLVGVVVVADFLERACTRRGHFNPRVAYDFMRKIRLGVLDWLPLPLLAVAVKFASEAVASCAAKLLSPRKGKMDPAVQARVAAIIAEPLLPGEKQVDISDLSPGMELSKPIHAFDGAQVLEGGLTLDEDLVMRIWQLASIRPLIDPTVRGH